MTLKQIAPITQEDIDQYIDKRKIQRFYDDKSKERNRIFISSFLITMIVFLMGLFRPNENNITYSKQPELTLIQSFLGILFFIGLLTMSFFIGRYSNVK